MNRKLYTQHGELNLAKKTAIMGILNVTPDSFSDGGQFNDIDRAVKQAEKMVLEGADIIDIGGESTRPGYTPVSEDEEIERVIPIIKKVREVVSVPISIDTFKAKTARYALEAGADIINDIWGAKFEPEIASVAAEYQAPIILMQNRKHPVYHYNLIDEVKADLTESIDLVLNKGVKKQQIIIDPGVGFAKNVEQNLEIIQNLDALKSLGYPILLGASRKSLIGHLLDLPTNERDEATAATTSYGIVNGADMVRVHNVKMNARVAKMTDLLVKKGGN
ncbi:dihydropteroate synthase [Amphibacillus jilinensis]|uniref:dihydropteroate synthase n=1 Tax=Amphibacillus jilinensis TaxID=1216008 RepID=UPI00031AFBF8|nr:dihydropteroate synthase [Amphibacillus jilinensis]